MAQTNDKHRRAFLKGAPIAALAAALTAGSVPRAMAEVVAVAAAGQETPVMTAFAAWSDINERLQDRSLPDDQFDKLCEELWDAEERIADIPAQTPADFIAKVIAMTNFGQNGLDSDEKRPEFWAEARAMINA